MDLSGLKMVKMPKWQCLILYLEIQNSDLNGTKNANLHKNKKALKWIWMKFKLPGEELIFKMNFLSNYQMRIWKNFSKKLVKLWNSIFFQRNKLPLLNSAVQMKQNLQFQFQKLKLEVLEYGCNIIKASMNFQKKVIKKRLAKWEKQILKIQKMM